jgi:hypothetical protein
MRSISVPFFLEGRKTQFLRNADNRRILDLEKILENLMNLW